MALTLRTGVSVTDTDYGIALLDEHSGEFWNLNPTAAVVLRALLAGDTAQTAARALTDEFAVDTGTAEADVTSLVGALRAAHLLDGEPAR